MTADITLWWYFVLRVSARLSQKQVCSPGGTTIAGVEALENSGFRSCAMRAVAAAAKRSAEMRLATAALPQAKL
eukprot:scaffold52850_cov31-Tisochrysis_lutea.AAC.2